MKYLKIVLIVFCGVSSLLIARVTSIAFYAIIFFGLYLLFGVALANQILNRRK